MRKQERVKRPTIGLLDRGIDEGYTNSFWKGVMRVANHADVNIILMVGGPLRSPEHDIAQGNIIYDFISPRVFDGLIFTGGLGHYIGQDQLAEFCSRYHPIPWVSLETALPANPSILPDFHHGMCNLLEHLIVSHGYRRIAFLRGPQDSPTGEMRYRAYQDTLEKHQILLDPNLVVDGTFFPPSGADAVRVLLDERKQKFDVLVAANDYMALDALHVLQQRGIRVPEEVAVTGFDNTVESRLSVPPLTTVLLPVE